MLLEGHWKEGTELPGSKQRLTYKLTGGASARGWPSSRVAAYYQQQVFTVTCTREECLSGGAQHQLSMHPAQQERRRPVSRVRHHPAVPWVQEPATSR